ncbi:hypothetical protein [Polaribacter gangjinensis]|uniref:Tetratricopeptide repeat protein n=1 Tax=Polaribacter gangjinensis TaxID=574710 RepID=A0A2S7WD17_9FLAO|nr:hypothetical protein [Polaribacter gangjinensis]PQJ75162.1 hypothetical protein BTO13_07840 [Polaribacter gangjinensis]
MKKGSFLDILQKNSPIQQVETAELKGIIDAFPYFQSARALYLKGLKNQESFKYNNELKITAAYTTDRTVLFDFITAANFDNPQKDIHQQLKEKISEEKKIEVQEIQQTSIIENSSEEIEEKLSIGKPISFKSSETYSFNQWLQLASKKPIERIENTASKIAPEKEEIIEKFIQNNPKIIPLPKDKNIIVTVEETKPDSSLMTETLAKVYLEQKKYENAIQAYRILSLKYPEKSGFFADQIKRVQILQKYKQ